MSFSTLIDLADGVRKESKKEKFYLAWMRKMLVLPSRSGRENSTFLPGRIRAGSRVAINTCRER